MGKKRYSVEEIIRSSKTYSPIGYKPPAPRAVVSGDKNKEYVANFVT